MIACISWIPEGGSDIEKSAFFKLSEIEKKDYVKDIIFEKQNLLNTEVQIMQKLIENLCKGKDEIISCYQLRNKWNDKQFIFNCFGSFYLYQWYTSE